MPTTKILLFEHKAKTNGEVPLYLRVIKDRKPRYVSLKVNVDPKYWDPIKEKVKPGHPNAMRINNYLAEKTREALDALLELSTRDASAPVAALKHAVMGVATTDFFEYGFRFIKQYHNKGKIGTYRRYQAVLNKLKAFAGEKGLQFNQITPQFLRAYETELRLKQNNQNNTVVGNFKAIRRIYNQAYKDQIFEVKRNPFNGFKLEWAPSKRVFLTEEEIAAIENLQLSPGTMKFHCRNMYLFACYAGGVRISDLLQLKWENIVNDHLILQTQKTGSLVSVKLPKKAIAIIDLYKSKSALKSDFIFPLLKKSDKLDNPTHLLHQIAANSTRANKSLQQIGADVNIYKHLSFHTSRHTFATRALKKGMRIEYVSKLLGHNSIKTTQIYAKIVNADLDKAMEVFDEEPVVSKTATTKKQSKKS